MDEILRILRYGGRPDLARLLRGSRYWIDESSTYGSYAFSVLSTVEVCVPLQTHHRVAALPDADAETIFEAFRALYPPRDNSVEIRGLRFRAEPDLDAALETSANTITRTTRRDIFDEMIVAGVRWSGQMEEQEFLARLFDLAKMRSGDSRHESAAGDIWRHRVANTDWSDDWILTDSRFDLLEAEDEVFVRFLCEALHPVVRPDVEATQRLAAMFNLHLRRDGYELVERGRLSGRQVFTGRQVVLSGTGAIQSIRAFFASSGSDYVLTQITRMEAAVSDDPGLAIGTAKELVETCCKTILHDRGVAIEGTPELPQLVKQTSRLLALTPDDIPEQAKASETIRRLLSNLATITQGLAELRNAYGTGHGKHARSKGLQPRHAQLAVGAASTLAAFLLETHQVRPAQPPNPHE